MINSLISIDMLDIYFILVLIGFIIMVFLVQQMGILPKKNVLWVITVGLLSIFSGYLFKKRRRGKDWKEAEEQRNQLEDQSNSILKPLKEEKDISEAETNMVLSELEKKIAAYDKNLLLINAKSQEQRDRFNSMSRKESAESLAKRFGSKKNKRRKM